MISFRVKAFGGSLVFPAKWLLAVLVGALVGVAAGYQLRPPVSIVDGKSMEPAYTPGTSVVSVPIPGQLFRGDVVILEDPEGGKVIKRIIGLPGETVQLLGGQVTINGRLLVEPYLDSRTATYPDRYRPRETFRLGQGEYFVLGDNRRASLDSRVYGPVGRSSISGLVIKPYLQVRARFENLDLSFPSGGRWLDSDPQLHS